MGLPRYVAFGSLRADATVARELLRAVEPLAIEAERRHRERQEDQRQILDLELRWARYEASPLPSGSMLPVQSSDRRAEKNWETELRGVQGLEARQPASCSLVQHCDDLLFRKPLSVHQSEGGCGAADCSCSVGNGVIDQLINSTAR